MRDLDIIDWGLVDYDEAYNRQLLLVEKRLAGLIKDTIVFVEHHKVITKGCNGDGEDILVTRGYLDYVGIGYQIVDRGGKTTYHEPGQLVIYPIIKIENNDVHLHLQNLLKSASHVLKSYGLNPELKRRNPGIWIKSKKLVSAGISYKNGIAYHGLAINVNNDMNGFKLIVPCGNRDEIFTSISKEIGRYVDINEVKMRFAREYRKITDEYSSSCLDQENIA